MHRKRLLSVFLSVALVAGLLSIGSIPAQAQAEDPEDVELFMPDGVGFEGGDDGFDDGTKTILSDNDDGEDNTSHLTSVSDDGDRHIFYKCEGDEFDGSSDFEETDICEEIGQDTDLVDPDDLAGELDYNIDDDEDGMVIGVLACNGAPDFDDPVGAAPNEVPENCAEDWVEDVTLDDAQTGGPQYSTGEITGVCPSDEADDCDRNQDFDDNGHGSELPDVEDGFTVRVTVSDEVVEDGPWVCLDVDANSGQDPDACDLGPTDADPADGDFDAGDENEFDAVFTAAALDGVVEDDDEVDVVLGCDTGADTDGDGEADECDGTGPDGDSGDALVLDEHYKVAGEQAVGGEEGDVVVTFAEDDHDDDEDGEDACENPDREANNAGEENEVLEAIVQGCLFDEDGNLIFDEEVSFILIGIGHIEECEGETHDHDDDGDDEHCHVNGATDGDDDEVDIFDILITNEEGGEGTGEVGDANVEFCTDDEQNSADEDDEPTANGHGCEDESDANKDDLDKSYGGAPENIVIIYADSDPTFADCFDSPIKSKQNQDGDTDTLLICTSDEDGQPAGTIEEDTGSIRVRSSNPGVILVTNDPSETNNNGTALATIEATAPGSAQVEAELLIRRAGGDERVEDEDILSKVARAADGEPRTIRQRRRVTIDFRRRPRPPRFNGEVVSSRARCDRGQRVVLRRAKRGRDKRAGRGVTNGRGRYSISKPRFRRGRYYIIVRRSTFQNRRGDTIICLKARSVIQRVGRGRRRR